MRELRHVLNFFLSRTDMPFEDHSKIDWFRYSASRTAEILILWNWIAVICVVFHLNWLINWRILTSNNVLLMYLRVCLHAHHSSYRVIEILEITWSASVKVRFIFVCCCCHCCWLLLLVFWFVSEWVFACCFIVSIIL